MDNKRDGSNSPSRLGRRAVVQGALAGAGGVAAGPLLPLSVGGAIAEAAPATPGSGAKATPNPIKPSITKSTIAVELVAFSTPKASASAPPRALLQMLYPLGDGSGRLFVNDARGKLWELDKKTGEATLFFDVSAVAGVKLLVIAGPFRGP